MRIAWWLSFSFLIGLSSHLEAAEYPISGAWTSTGPSADQQKDAAAACASYSKKPKAPVGNILVFKGTKKTEFNGGYLEEETVDNVSVQRLKENEFQVVDRYYDDGEGGGKAGYKRRTYLLRMVSQDKIEIKEGKYPGSQYFRCAALTSNTIPTPNSRTPSQDASPRKSEDVNFFSRDLPGGWRGSGSINNRTRIDVCRVGTQFDDGTLFHLAKDLSRNTLNISIRNKKWIGPEKKTSRDVKFALGADGKTSLQTPKILRGSFLTVFFPDGAVILDINEKIFIPAFLRSNVFILTDIPNSISPGSNTFWVKYQPSASLLLKTLSECIEIYKSRKRVPPNLDAASMPLASSKLPGSQNNQDENNGKESTVIQPGQCQANLIAPTPPVGR